MRISLTAFPIQAIKSIMVPHSIVSADTAILERKVLSDLTGVDNYLTNLAIRNTSLERQIGRVRQVRDVIPSTYVRLLYLLIAVLASGSALADDDISMTVPGMLSDRDVMQAANACLLRHPKGDTTFVENVYPMNHGMVGIVTADTSGRRYDCNVELGSGKIHSSNPIVEPKGPLFISVRQVQTPPKGDCFSTDPLVIGRQLQGWLLTQTGKCGGTSWNGIATAVKIPQNP